MATIENVATSPEKIAEWHASMSTMSAAELLAQQLVQRGAEHVLMELIRIGVTADNAQQLLASIRHGLVTIHEAAHARGITLCDYSA